jgi:hypothetical protein
MAEMFEAMRRGGDFLLEDIAYFNGGLFEHVEVIELVPGEIEALLAASRMDWSAIEPSILGTLFERGLDPKIRAPLGANYTDPGTIMKLVRPIVVEPLECEWEAAKARIGPLIEKYQAGGKGSQKAGQDAQALFLGYLERLKNFRVLDAACGSGNFLYLALRALKDLEHRANLDAEALGLHRQLTIETSPDNVRGIEINAYAAELARVTVWIGEIQWMLKHGYDCRRNPILARLDHIENRDALLNEDGSEAEWPAVDAIVGNPPFLGDKRMRSELGAEMTARIRSCYDGRVPGGADLVLYWFEKARAQIEAKRCEAVGLVATNSIRGGANRKVLDRIVDSTRIFEAWSDEPWVNEGAAVRVSLVCFGNRNGAVLDGRRVQQVHADLTAMETGQVSSGNVTAAKALVENEDAAFLGIQKTGPFDIPGESARQMLLLPNPHGKPNADVLKPWFNGLDITRRNRDFWIIDFGVDMKRHEAAHPGRKTRGEDQRELVDLPVGPPQDASGYQGNSPLHRDPRGVEASHLRMGPSPRRTGQEPDSHRTPRRHNLRCPALTLSRALGVTPRHQPRGPAALHPHDDLRNLSFPRRDDARRHGCRRSVSSFC